MGVHLDKDVPVLEDHNLELVDHPYACPDVQVVHQDDQVVDHLFPQHLVHSILGVGTGLVQGTQGIDQEVLQDLPVLVHKALDHMGQVHHILVFVLDNLDIHGHKGALLDLVEVAHDPCTCEGEDPCWVG